MSALADAATSFGLTVLSETGDKSQLLLIALSARWQRSAVAVGGIVGIIGVQLVAVLLGGWLGAAGNERISETVGMVVGVAFVVVGLIALDTARRAGAENDGAENDDDRTKRRQPATWQSTAAATAGLLFAAELGDKTMFTTAGLSAVRSPLAVLAGATAAFAALTVVAVLVGRAFATRVPHRTLAILAGAAFLVTGVITLATL